MLGKVKCSEIIVYDLDNRIFITEVSSSRILADKLVLFPVMRTKLCGVRQVICFPMPFFFSLPKEYLLPVFVKFLMAMIAKRHNISDTFMP